MTDDSTKGGSSLFVASSLAVTSSCEGTKMSPPWGGGEVWAPGTGTISWLSSEARRAMTDDPSKGGGHVVPSFVANSSCTMRRRQNVSVLGRRRRLGASRRGAGVLGSWFRVFLGFIWGPRLRGGGGAWRGRSGPLRAFRRPRSSFLAIILVIIRKNAFFTGSS